MPGASEDSSPSKHNEDLVSGNDMQSDTADMKTSLRFQWESFDDIKSTNHKLEKALSEIQKLHQQLSVWAEEREQVEGWLSKTALYVHKIGHSHMLPQHMYTLYINTLIQYTLPLEACLYQLCISLAFVAIFFFLWWLWFITEVFLVPCCINNYLRYVTIEVTWRQRPIGLCRGLPCLLYFNNYILFAILTCICRRNKKRFWFFCFWWDNQWTREGSRLLRNVFEDKQPGEQWARSQSDQFYASRPSCQLRTARRCRSVPQSNC